MFGNWLQQIRDRRARALPDGYIDVVELYKKGLVGAEATGQSITEISAEITSRVRRPLKVAVPHGTYFVSRGHHQNMVTRRKYRFELRSMQIERISVPAACINATLPIPSRKDRFRGVARVSADVRRFLEAAETEDAMVIQAGVWAVTNRLSRSQIQSVLRTRRVVTRYGIELPGGPFVDDAPAISDRHIDRARELLDGLRIANRL